MGRFDSFAFPPFFESNLQGSQGEAATEARLRAGVSLAFPPFRTFEGSQGEPVKEARWRAGVSFVVPVTY
jgi:hypothetical protein